MRTVVELCAGAGGQSLGLEAAGFKHLDLVEMDEKACKTLQMNRPEWNVSNTSIKNITLDSYKGVDLLAAGVPCPPFSVAGKMAGNKDERDLFPTVLELISQCQPRAIMFENVPGLLSPKFASYYSWIKETLESLGFVVVSKICNASQFGISQFRPRVFIIGLRQEFVNKFNWPKSQDNFPLTVGEILYNLMSVNNWRGAKDWKVKANKIAPTIVGGSMKHGGADLGPTGSKRAWSKLRVDGHSIANNAPEINFDVNKRPRLTLEMVAKLQGFPSDWIFPNKKTATYRQIGNALPPAMAQAIGSRIHYALSGIDS